MRKDAKLGNEMLKKRIAEKQQTQPLASEDEKKQLSELDVYKQRRLDLAQDPVFNAAESGANLPPCPVLLSGPESLQ